MATHPTMQRTLRQVARCAGVGVHSGERASLVLRPAPANSGIVFRRIDLGLEGTSVPAHADAVTDTRLGTTLSNEFGVTVAVVEHLMAALSGHGVDNLLIDLDGPEVPIMDGSASVFFGLVREAGLVTQTVPRRRLRILERIEIIDGPKRASLSPAYDNSLTLRARIEYDDACIGVQQMAVRLSAGMFASDIALARTYGFERDVDALRSMGLARGGSLENAVVIGENGIMNPEGLRIENEFVRHKILDAVGDLALAGGPIAGAYDAVQPGHALNNRLVRKLLATPTAWCWETDVADAGRYAARAAV